LRAAFRLIRAEPPRDILAWANDRLKAAWRPCPDQAVMS